MSPRATFRHVLSDARQERAPPAANLPGRLESVVAFDLVDGQAVSVAAHYTDQELVSQPSGEVVDTFHVDCVSVSIHATSPGLVDTDVLAAGIRERMRVHEPDCPAS